MDSYLPAVETLAAVRIPALRALCLTVYETSEGTIVVPETKATVSSKSQGSNTKTVRPGRKGSK